MMEGLEASLDAAVRAGTPLLLASVGEIYAERSGILNLGVEGLMICGALTAFAVTYSTGNPWIGVFAAALVGGLLSLIHGLLSISLRANQVISGIALTMFGLGLSSFVGRKYIGIPINPIPKIKIGFLGDLPLIGKPFFQQDPLVYFSLILTFILWLILFHTRIGINIRSVGENPEAADAMGVNVYLTRYICVFLGGCLGGLGGAYLSIAYTPAWIERMTAGRGWIAVALAIFSLWDPLKAVIGSYLFGGIEAIQFRLQPLGIPASLLGMLPFLLTIAVLVIVSKEVMRKKIGAPSCLGIPYARGEK